MSSMDKEKAWRRTDNRYGHKRNFKHICSTCGHDKMILYSTTVIPGSVKAIPGKERLHFVEEPCNIMEFQCERCFLMDRFIVSDTREYLEKILKLRDGVNLYIPSQEEK